MENQHKKIKGYRDLSQEEIDLMNLCKNLSVEIGEIVEKLETKESIDKRWLGIGKVDLQKGFMGIIRSIAKPETF